MLWGWGWGFQQSCFHKLSQLPSSNLQVTQFGQAVTSLISSLFSPELTGFSMSLPSLVPGYIAGKAFTWVLLYPASVHHLKELLHWTMYLFSLMSVTAE